jgi:DNA-directed RNA polymerase subunit RPC12/RpoP
MKLSPLNQSTQFAEVSQENQPQEACKQSPPSPTHYTGGRCPKCGSEVVIFKFKFSANYACTNKECTFAASNQTRFKRSRAK